MRVFIFAVAMVLTAQSQAAQKQQDTNAVLARSTASFMNRMSNVEEYLAIMDRHVTQEQMEKFKKQLSLNGIQGKNKIPKMRYDGNKAYFDKKNYIIYVDESTVNINGHEIKKGVKGIDVVYREVMEKIAKPKSASFSLALIPEAQALTDMGGLIGMVGAGALGYIVGPMIGMSAGVGALAAAGAFFVGNELYQSFRDGGISCQNGKFAVRRKVRPGLFSTGVHEELDHDTLSQVFGSNVPRSCNSETLKMYKKGVNNFGNSPRPVGVPPYVQQGTSQDVPQKTEGAIVN